MTGIMSLWTLGLLESKYLEFKLIWKTSIWQLSFRTTEWNCLFCEFLWCQSFVSVQVTRNFDNSIRQGTCYTDFSCVNKRVYCVWLDLLLHSAWLQLLCVCTTELQTEKGSKLSFTAQVTLSELRCKLEKEHVHVKRSIWLSIISS